MSIVLIFFCLLFIVLLWCLFFTSYKTVVKRFLKEKHDAFCARILNRFSPKYNEKMHVRKKALIQDGLQRYQGEPGRRITLLEIGAGTGINFAYYPDGTVVTCLEPNNKCESYLLANAAKFPNIKFSGFHIGFAENMSHIESCSVDAVVGTLVLCSVDNIDMCLKEVIRILKPGGKFFFMEHIRERKSGSTISFFQSVLCRPWWFVCHCRLANNTDVNIRSAGFSHVELDVFDAIELVTPTSIMLVVASLVRPHLSGIATK